MDSTLASRPPNAPKPSRNQAGLERQRQLQDRLKLRWDQKQPLYRTVQLGPTPTIDSVVKGYGEGQFVDSVDQFDQGGDSLWVGSTDLPGGSSVLLGGDKLTMDRGLVASSVQRSIVVDHRVVQSSGNRSSLQHSVAALGSVQSSSARVAQPAADDEVGSGIVPRFAPIPHSHLEVSQSLEYNGLAAVAESLVLGQTGFCYIDNVNDDFYQFNIRSEVPSDMQKSTYITLSERGVMRSVPGGEEITSFRELGREIMLYRQLVQLPVFKHFKLWKPFLVWRRQVRGKKFKLMQEAVAKKLLWMNEFNRKLLLAARAIALQVNSFVIFAVDHRDFSKTGIHNNTVEFTRFIDMQKRSNEAVRQRVVQIKEALVEMLSIECEEHICTSTQEAPSSLPHDQYFTIKMSSIGNQEEIALAAQENRARLQAAVLADEAHSPTAASTMRSEVQAAIDNTLDSMSAVSTYIYNTTNISSMGNQVYNVEYTQELLDDQSISSSYSGTKQAGYGASLANRRRHLTAVKDRSQLTVAAGPPPLAALPPTHVSYSVRAAIRVVCRQIYHVFRIVDYMLRDLLHDKLRDELSLLNSLLLTAFEYFDSQSSALSADLKARHDKAVPVVEEDSSVSSYLKKDMNRNKSKLQSIFFNIVVDISEFDYNVNTRGHRSATSTLLEITEQNASTIEVSLLPSMDSCLDEFTSVLKDTCQLCKHTEGLLFNKRCLDIISPVHKEVVISPMEDRIFVEGDHLNDIYVLTHNCVVYLQRSFQLICAFLAELSPYKTEFTSNVHRLIAMETNRLASSNSENLLADYERWDRKAVEYAAIHSKFVVGTFQLVMAAFRTNMLNNNNCCIQSYNKFVPELYISVGDAFYKDVSKYIDRLSRPFHSIDYFVKNVEVYNALVAKQDDINDSFTYISKLKDVLDIRGIRLSDEVSRQTALLTNVYTKLNLLIGTFGDSFESQVKIYRNEIIARLKTIMAPIDELQNYLASLNLRIQTHYGVVVVPSAVDAKKPTALHAALHKLPSDKEPEDEEPFDMEDTLARLLKFKTAINQISNQLQTLDHYQQLLCISVFEYSAQLEIQNDLNANIVLLNSHLVITALHENVKATNYVDVNHLAVLKELAAVRQELEGSEFFNSFRMLPPGAEELVIAQPRTDNTGMMLVYQNIFAVTAALETCIPIVSILQSKALTSDHQRAINALVKYTIFDVPADPVDPAIRVDSDYTIDKLVHVVGITQFASELNSIYQEAVISYNLECKLGVVINQINSLEMVFSSETDSKLQLHLLNYQILVEDLQDYITSLTSLLSSSYASWLVTKYAAVLPEVGDFLVYIRHFNTVQLAHNKYRLLFVSPRTARHMSAYMRNYKAVDDSYRMLVKSAKSLKAVGLFVNEKNTKAYIQTCLDNLEVIEKGFLQVLQEFCDRYPKLYLVHENVFYQSFLMNNMKDVVMLLTPYVFPSMHITSIEYDLSDDSSIVGITSAYQERLSFNKTCSARNNVHDFFKALDTCIHEKFEKDIRDMIVFYLEEQKNLSLVDEVKNNSSKYTAQALLLIYQIQFWNNFWRLFINPAPATQPGVATLSGAAGLAIKSGYNRSAQSKLKSFMLELQDSVNMLYTIYTEPISPYGIQLTSNIIITIAYYRDLIKNVLEEYNLTWDHELNAEKEVHKIVHSISLVFCNLQKYIEFYTHNVNSFNIHQHLDDNAKSVPDRASSNVTAVLNNIYVAIGGEKVKYGLKYLGFADRMVVHPIVDKFYYSMVQTLHHHSVAYVTNPIASTHCSIGSIEMLQTLSAELGVEQFFFQTKNLGLFSRDPYLFQARSSVDEDFGERTHTNIVQFNRVVRAAMKTGMWVTLICEDCSIDKTSHTTLLSYIASVLSLVYSELHNKNQQHSATNYVNNVDEFATHYRTLKYEVLGGTTVDHATLNQMKFILFNNNLCNQHIFHTLFHSSHAFRPITLPSVSVKIVLNIVLSSYNFIYVHKLSERLEQLLSFLIHHKYAGYHVLKYLLVQTIRHIGNHNDHMLINVSMQLQLIVKRFLNNLPSPVICRIRENEHFPVIYNLFLEMIFDPAKDANDYYIKSYRESLSWEDELVARLWDSTSTTNFGGYNVQLHNNLINFGVFRNDIQSIATYNKLPPMPISDTLAGSANTTTVAAMNVAATGNGIYKRNVIVLGADGCGKTELIMKSLATLKVKYFFADKPNIRILPYAVNPKLLKEEGEGMATSRNPLFFTVDREASTVVRYLQNFLNGDYARSCLNVIYLDIVSFAYNTNLLHQISLFISNFYRLHRVKIIYEATALADIDPSFLTQFDVIYVDAPLYSVEQLIGKHMAQCIEGEPGVFRRVVEEMTIGLVQPTVEFVLEALPVEQRPIIALHLVPQVFTLITTLFYQYVYPQTDYGSSVLNPVAPPQSLSNRSPRRSMNASQLQLLQQQQQPPTFNHNFVHVNKAYKLPNAVFDEDSARRIVVYAVIWACGAYNFHEAVNHCSLASFQASFESQVRLLLGSAGAGNYGFRKIAPREHSSIFGQYLYPRVQADSHVSNMGGGGVAASSGSLILEWTVIDQKQISEVIYSQSKARAVNESNFLLHSTILFPYQNFHDIYVMNSISLNAAYLQGGLAHMIPMQLQSTPAKQKTGVLDHHFNNIFNVFNARGLLIHGSSPGCGKKALLKQLLHGLLHSKYPNTHWAGYTNSSVDQRYHNLSHFIMETQRKLSRKRYEQNILNVGCVFIEDLNINSLYANDGHNSTLRSLMQFNTVFDDHKLQFRVFNSFYVAACAKNSTFASSFSKESGGNVVDRRLTRHFLNLQIPHGHITHVLSAFLEHSVGPQYHEISHDLAHVAYHLVNNLQQIIATIVMSNAVVFKLNNAATIQAASVSADAKRPSRSTPSAMVVDTSNISAPAASIPVLFSSICEKHPPSGYDNHIALLYPLLRSSAAKQSKDLLNQLVLALYAFNGAGHSGEVSKAQLVNIAAQDFLQIFDRVLCDFIARFVHIEYIMDLVNCTLEHTLNYSIDEFKFNNMMGQLDKVRQIRVGNYENISSNPSNNMNICEPLSYTRGLCGTYKTGNNVFPVLLTAEFIRDLISKNIAAGMASLYGDKTGRTSVNLAHFTSTIDVVSSSARALLPAASELVRLFRNSLAFWHDVLRFVAFWTNSLNSVCNCSVFVVNNSATIYNIHSVNHDVRELYHKSHTEQRLLARVLVALHFFNNARLEIVAIKECVGSRAEASIEGLGIDMKYCNFANCLRKVLHFLADDLVLHDLCQHIRSRRLTRDTTEAQSVESHGLVAPSALATLRQLLSDSEFEKIGQIEVKYAALVQSEHAPRHMRYEGLQVEDDVTIWLVTCDDKDCLHRYLSDLTLQSSYVAQLLRWMNADLDIEIHARMAKLVVEYNKRQKILVADYDAVTISDPTVSLLSSRVPSGAACDPRDKVESGNNVHPHNNINKGDENKKAIARIAQAVVPEYFLFSEYATSDDVMEKLLQGFIANQRADVGGGGRIGTATLSEKELEDQEQREAEHLQLLLCVINDFMLLCYDGIVTHYSYNLPSKPADDEEGTNPFLYVFQELKLVFCQYLQNQILYYASADFAALKTRMREMMHSYVAYDFRTAFFGDYAPSWQPVDMLLFISFSSFYHCQLPSKYVYAHHSHRQHHIKVSELVKFVIEHLPVNISSSKLPCNANRCGVQADHVLGELDGLCILYNNLHFALGNVTEMEPDFDEHLSAWSMIYCLPSTRLCKSYLLAVYHLQLTSHLVIKDHTFLASFFLNDILHWQGDMACRGRYLFVSVAHTAQRAAFNHRSTATILLSHSDYLADFFLLYLLEHGLLASPQTELQRLYVQRKDYFRDVLLSPLPGSAADASGARQLNARFNTLYCELAQKVTRCMETVMLIFTNINSVHGQDSGVAMLSTLFHEFLRHITLTLARADQSPIEQIMGAAVYHLLDVIIPSLTSEEAYTNLVLNVVLDFFYLPYHLPRFAQVKLLMEQRYKLLVLIKDLYSLAYDEGEMGYNLDKKFGIVAPVTTTGSPGSSVPNSPTIHQRKKISQTRTVSADGRSAESGSGSDSDSDSDSDAEKSTVAEQTMLSPQSKSVFKQMLLLISSIFPARGADAADASPVLLDSFHTKYIPSAANTTFNLSILDDISEDVDIYVDFSTDVYYTGILFPSNSSYTMTVLDKLLLCFVCKVNVVSVLCRDFVMAHGCGVDTCSQAMQDLLQPKTATRNLDSINIMPPPDISSSPMRSRMSSFVRGGGEASKKPVVVEDVTSARDLVHHIYSSPLPSMMNTTACNVYVCHGLADVHVVVDYIMQNNRAAFLAAQGESGLSTGALSRAASNLRAASVARMQTDAPVPDTAGTPPSPRISHSPSKLVRANSISGAGGTLQAIFDRSATTVFYDNRGFGEAANWTSHLVKYLLALKNNFGLTTVVHAVCLEKISVRGDWMVLKQFLVRERMVLILSAAAASIQDVAMNTHPGLGLLPGKSFVAPIDARQPSRRQSIASDLGSESSDDAPPRAPAQEDAARTLLAYPTASLLHTLHAFDAKRVAQRIKQYIHYMSHLTYLADNTAATSFVLAWPPAFGPQEQVELLKISKLVVNRVRWLLIFLHISVAYYYETVRFGNYQTTKHGSILNDTLLYHAAHTLERLWLNILNRALLDAKGKHADPLAGTGLADGADRLFSTHPLVNAVVERCFDLFDEIVIHHVVLLLVYYPYLQANLTHNSVLDELQVKYIFESIFTSKACAYTSSYYVLNKLALPLEINIYRFAEVEAFYQNLLELLAGGADDDSSADKHHAEGALLDLLFVSQPQASTKAIYSLQQPLHFNNHYGVHINYRFAYSAVSSCNAPPPGDPLPDYSPMPTKGFHMFTKLYSLEMDLLHLKHALWSVLEALPVALDLKGDPHIFHTSQTFKISKELEQMRGRSTMIARPQNILQTLKARRKAGQRVLLQFQARDYDSVWMQMVSEAFVFNQQLAALKGFLTQLGSACSSGSHLSRFFQAQAAQPLSSPCDPHVLIQELLHKLTAGCIPDYFTSYRDGTLQALSFVDVRQFVQLWGARRDMLRDYLYSGSLNTLRLHLLHNPQGLFFSLKESYAMKSESSIEKVFLHFDLCSVAQHNKYMTSIFSANAGSGGVDLKENNGCNLRAVGLTLFQARLGGPGATAPIYTSGANSASLSLHFLPAFAQSSFGTEVVLHIFPSLVEQSAGPDRFLCPLFVSTFPSVPAGCAMEGNQSTRDVRHNAQKQALCWVPVPTPEDTAACALSRVALFSKPPFLVPM